MSKWVSVTKNSTTLGTSEVNIISPFELSPLTDDVIIQIMETSGNAATIRVYGSIGTATNTESVPEFPTGGNNWGGD